MRNIVFGVIGMLWGGLILIGLLRNGLQGEGAYRAGQVFGLLFGVLLLGAGAYYLVSGFLKLQAGPGSTTRKRKRKRIRRPLDDE